MILPPIIANIKKTVDPYLKINNYPVNVEKVLFFDVETASEYENLSLLLKHDPEKYNLYEEKCDSLRKFNKQFEELTNNEIYDSYIGLLAEYNKVICISFGYIGRSGEFQMGSFAIDNENFYSEKDVIENFAALLNKVNKLYVCGANILQFDIPLLCKKMFIYGIMPPEIIWSFRMKPWLAKAIDITDIWGGSAKMRDTRLKTICKLLGINSPKDEIEGKDVSKYFYEGKILDIVKYCEKDVYATYEVFLALQKLEKPS